MSELEPFLNSKQQSFLIKIIKKSDNLLRSICFYFIDLSTVGTTEFLLVVKLVRRRKLERIA